MAAERNRSAQLPDRDEWITAREGAALTGYNEAYLRHLAAQGRIASQKIAAAVLLSKSSLLAYKSAMDALGTKRFSKTRAKLGSPATRSGVPQHTLREAAGSALYAAEFQVRSIFDLPFMSKEELRARNEAAIALLKELASATGEEAEDQRETGKLLMKALAGPRLLFHTVRHLARLAPAKDWRRW
ncbi:MAG: hypothetical protein RMN52_00130 [Anaerolineae bacterium]|nr:hypothetical protein [Candidatus Roseilinea sp.]MDW8448383.1 hypothetical protein [Anaerolineae bacterium]